MEPSGFGGMGEHLQGKCTGSMPWLGASSSCLISDGECCSTRWTHPKQRYPWPVRRRLPDLGRAALKAHTHGSTGRTRPWAGPLLRFGTCDGSLASWYNHVSSSNQYQYFTPSTTSKVEDRLFSMDCCRKYEEARPANESDTGPEKLPMQHFEQQIASGYSSS